MRGMLLGLLLGTVMLAQGLPASAGPEDEVLDGVARIASQADARALITVYGPRGAIEHEVPVEVAAEVIELARGVRPELLASAAVPAASRLGAGSSHLPVPWTSCAFALVRIEALGDHALDSVLVEATPAREETGVLGSGEFCGLPFPGRIGRHEHVDATWSRVAFDLRETGFPFGMSQQVAAQVDLANPWAPLDVRAFDFAVARGEGRLVQVELFGWPNFQGLYFFGNGATVEVWDVPPPEVPEVPS